jgi:tetratricopeptide (TPR) repeat protein
LLAVGVLRLILLILELLPEQLRVRPVLLGAAYFSLSHPLSFPMTLHLAKLALDLSRVKIRQAAAEAGALVVLAALIGLNLFQTAKAVRPGLMYRSNLLAVVTDLRAYRPSELVTEAWLGYFLRHVYLKDVSETRVIPVLNTYRAHQYERWLERRQASFPQGTMLLTGIGSCVHYGGHYDGFRLAQFRDDLHPAWKPVKEYGVLSDLPVPEAVRLWEWSGGMTDSPPASADVLSRGQNPNALFQAGMTRFDQGDCLEAQPHFQRVFEDFPKSQRAADALYFHAICVFRNARWQETIAWFRKLVEDYPGSRWVAGAHYHIGLSQAALGDTEQARASFEYVRDHFPNDPALAKLAEEQLEKLPARTGLLEHLFRVLRSH